ncbi:MAG: phosphoribosylformylglycinamidine synthase subunit PurQ [Deltaproteobacteria bacterium]|nr:phosphoribosylformylglycinamidine synthase subunit PurQ [Deltaproteobacteria bacterium]
MGKVNAIVISGNGINCEMEMAHALRLAGSDRVDIVNIFSLLDGDVNLLDYNFINFAGGFLDGDNLGSARAGAVRIRFAKIRKSEERLLDKIIEFIKRGGLILGVCNGFQLLVKLGLLPGFDNIFTEQKVTLTFNKSGRFEDRWVNLRVNQNSECVFTRGIKHIYLPVRHGEGRFLTDNDETLERLRKDNHIVLQYVRDNNEEFTVDYPFNPNGSVLGIAGICSRDGRIFGLMPHPEAFLHYTNHPRWFRECLPEEGDGLKLFKNAVDFLKNR